MPAINPDFFEEHYDITTQFKLNASLRREPLDADFVHEISGRILCILNDGERTERAGALSATLVQFDEAMENQIDLFWTKPVCECQRLFELDIAAPTAADPKDIIRVLGMP